MHHIPGGRSGDAEARAGNRRGRAPDAGKAAADVQWGAISPAICNALTLIANAAVRIGELELQQTLARLEQEGARRRIGR
jgi:hypothetical protein